jgi:hypothetical protein
MTRYFIDTDFIEDGSTIDLISIGIVAEDGREFYAVNLNCDFDKASDWVKENVIPQLPHRSDPAWATKTAIASNVIRFVIEEPEIWADYGAFDWVAFCWLFGMLIDLPESLPMYYNDLRTEWNRLGRPQLPKQDEGIHNALVDARHNRVIYDFLRNYAVPQKLNTNMPSSYGEYWFQLIDGGKVFGYYCSFAYPHDHHIKIAGLKEGNFYYIDEKEISGYYELS